ncbi:aspartyl-tRNA(Asn)/glutamyl-tRNA(Gln) amidotransferase subunit A [Actinomadura pelletieri DSM 43383]|uniref:Aspartyl-tRNA(Asn)/glutamyl-tRNA(Gln) amidotransferase subunit A n=1 Tax=Actinomadura pelletieri DSM 43383 TaxID=1120940 RepID=A0A495QUI0_9ACTN|nr:amidase [Actinomadura pelletieri]RKS77149.1 aspartyl-tRNA(Asn)/glutamyl-tRNA(Gln) amidotransferase subunit A [Actinomadura pelletieri DSM 43383]
MSSAEPESPVDLTERMLAAIEATEPLLHAYATVTAEAARARAAELAAELESGTRRGPLHGFPVGIKDLIDTAGVPTAYGSPRFTGHVPARDAEAVRRLRDAGAVILGKHTTHELAWGGRTDSPFFGPTHNPYRRGHIPGGSSGGSAASVVVGSSQGAVGSDTAGSVRIPAALSGCVGFKPTRGLIPLDGVLPLAPSLDHLGVLAGTVHDAALLASALTATPLAGAAPDGSPAPRVGWLGGWFDAVLAPEVRAALADVRARLEGHGVRVEDVAVPDEPRMPEAVLNRILAEAGAYHRNAFEQNPALFGPDIAELMRLPARTAEDAAQDEAAIARTTAFLTEALGAHDVLVGATVPITAPPIGAMTVDVAGREWPVELVLTRLTSLFNAAGLPAVSVPVALADGLPVGLQLAGAAGRDDAVLDAARLVERLVPRPRRPDLVQGRNPS